MRIAITKNEYAASQNLIKMVIDALDEMTGSEPSLKAASFDDAADTLVELQKKTTAIKEVSVSDSELSLEIAEDFVVELFDELYTPITKKVIRLVLVTIDTLKGIMMDAKAAASIFVKKWTK